MNLSPETFNPFMKEILSNITHIDVEKAARNLFYNLRKRDGYKIMIRKIIDFINSRPKDDSAGVAARTIISKMEKFIIREKKASAIATKEEKKPDTDREQDGR
ncbi:MAG: hypothetical protein RTU92_07630 [Candidatus Thorarchaeota archaeon]